MSITFIVPCYNCENIIEANYKKLNRLIKSLREKTYLILINDGSNDSTLQILNKIKKRNTKIINNKINLGKSRSIINSLRLVKTKKVILIDCDLSYFEYLKTVIKNLNKFDLVTVNRRMINSKNIDKNFSLYQISRNLISNFLSFIIEKKLKLHVKGDTQAGLKAFRMSEKLKKIKFISKYYFFDIELINFFRKNNLKIKLVAVKYRISRVSSIRFFSLKNLFILLEFIKVLSKN